MRFLMSMLRIILGVLIVITAVVLLIVLIFGNNGASKQEAKHDAEKLDAQLATVHIDRVEFVSWDRETTNTVPGAEAQKILASLAATNRMSGTEWKDKSRRVYFMNGKQKVLDFVLDDSGLWHYGEYRFVLRSQ
jgi:hypothetical protein